MNKGPEVSLDLGSGVTFAGSSAFTRSGVAEVPFDLGATSWSRYDARALTSDSVRDFASDCDSKVTDSTAEALWAKEES